jgi:outer membrane protein
MRAQMRGFVAVVATMAFLPVVGRAQDAGVQAMPDTYKLSLEDAVRVDIQVEKLSPESAALTVKQAEGFYDLNLTGLLARGSKTTPAGDAFATAEESTTSTWDYNLGAVQPIKTGGDFSLNLTNNRSSTDRIKSYDTYNPLLTSNLAVTFRQPLLKNFKIDSSRQQLRVAKKNRQISDVQFKQVVVNTISTVKKSYYDLIATIDNLAAAQRNLALAQKLQNENEIKVKVGTMAPLEVVSAKAEVAAREEGVIVAEALVKDAEDAMRRQLFPGNDERLWSVKIQATDRPTAEPFVVDIEAATKRALSDRTDVQVARLGLERSDFSVQYAKSQTLPGMDLVASYGGYALGGTSLSDAGTGGTGWSDVYGKVLGFDFPTWTVRANLSYPIRNRSARASHAQAQVAKRQAELSLRRLELLVATEVRSTGRAVETNFKRVASTKAARVLAEQRLDAEEKKFAAGMTTNFQVTQAQRDLADAQVNEIRSVLDYHKSLVDFQRVQEAGSGF